MTYAKSIFILMAVTLLLSTGESYAFDRFDNVKFVSPMVRDNQVVDPNAMELSDMRLVGRLSAVGQPYLNKENKPTVERVDETLAYWGEPGMMRIRYRPEVRNAEGEVLFHFGPLEDPASNRYDYANQEKRREVGEAMVRSLDGMDSEWIMFDEPTWGYRGLENARDLPISQSLNEGVMAVVGRPIESVDAYLNDPELWHAFVYVRHRALVESLKEWSGMIRAEGKRVTVNIIPSGMESGAVAGFEIATAMDVFGDSIDMIQIDPYYTLFVEDTRYPGFTLRMLDEHTPRDMPILGWTDSVNGVREELAIKNPPPESMKPQLASYLANGSDHLAVWSYAYLEAMGNREAYQEMVRWIRENQALFRGNPRLSSRTGIYFSNLTFVMNDYFPRAWSHGTGPLGQYFTVLNTYYMATVNQVPLRVLSTPLGHEDRLAGMLEGLDRLIIADALVMTDSEVEAIRSWVEQGGTLINIGTSGILNEYRKERPGGLAEIAGIGMTSVRPRGEMIFTKAWPAPGGVERLSLEGSNETLLIGRYQENRNYALNSENNRAHYYPERWPLHVRDEGALLEKTRRLPDPKPEDMPPLGAAGLTGGTEAEVLARFGDGEAAIVERHLGQGRVIQIAPTDWLTRYRDPEARKSAHVLFCEVTEPEVRLIAAGDTDLASVELVVTERQSRESRAMIVHLVRHVHDDQAILTGGEPLKELTLRLPLSGEETVTFVQGFSPDSEVAALSYNRDGNELSIELPELDVYTAIMIGLKSGEKRAAK